MSIIVSNHKIVKSAAVSFPLLSFSRFPGSSLSEMRYSDFYRQPGGDHWIATTEQAIALGTNFEVQLRYRLSENTAPYTALIGIYNDNNKAIGVQYQSGGASSSPRFWIGFSNKSENGWISYYVYFPKDTEWHTFTLIRKGTHIRVDVDSITRLSEVSSSDVSDMDIAYPVSFGTNYSHSYQFDGVVDWWKSHIKTNGQLVWGSPL